MTEFSHFRASQGGNQNRTSTPCSLGLSIIISSLFLLLGLGSCCLFYQTNISVTSFLLQSPAQLNFQRVVLLMTTPLLKRPSGGCLCQDDKTHTTCTPVPCFPAVLPPSRSLRFSHFHLIPLPQPQPRTLNSFLKSCCAEQSVMDILQWVWIYRLWHIQTMECCSVLNKI